MNSKFLFIAFASLFLGFFAWPLWFLTSYIVVYGIIRSMNEWVSKQVGTTTNQLHWGVDNHSKWSSWREKMIKLETTIQTVKQKFFPFDQTMMTMMSMPPAAAPMLTASSTCTYGVNIYSPSLGKVTFDECASKRDVSVDVVIGGVFISLLMVIVFLLISGCANFF